MKYEFDAQLIGEDGIEVPVFCEIKAPCIAGQKSHIQVSVPIQHLSQMPPRSPCKLIGECGVVSIRMEGVYWRMFPTSSPFTHGMEKVELLHVDRLIVMFPSTGTRREVRFHLSPVSYLRSISSGTRFDNNSLTRELFLLDLPGLGSTSFALEWVIQNHRDEDIPGATISAGFSAVACLSENELDGIDELVSRFRKSLDVLSVLFRQATSLHGWTYTGGVSVTTWISPLAPNVTKSAREDRGRHLIRPQGFEEGATNLAQAYAKATPMTQSLVRHLSLALNPHQNLRDSDHFLFMFAALERVIETAWTQEKAKFNPTSTTEVLVKYLEEIDNSVIAKGGNDAQVISARLKGLIGIAKGPTYKDKFEAFLRVHAEMRVYSRDLWPVMGTVSERGLREIRHAIAHGSSSFVSVDVVAVAKWHLAILIERVVFVLLNLPVPEGIIPNSYLLRIGGRGEYERGNWEPLRSERDHPI